MTGRLSTYIGKLLGSRRFRWKMGTTLSEMHTQEIGIPKGSVLSSTLIVIRIGKIALVLLTIKGHHAALHMDHLQISYAHINLDNIHNQL